MRATRRSWLAALMLLMLAVPTVSRAQKPPTWGYIRGTVLDTESGNPLPYGNVVFKKAVSAASLDGEAIGGAIGNEKGVFLGRVQPGLYLLNFTYISYEPQTVRGVFVAAGDTVTVNASLKLTPMLQEKVTVEVEAIRTAEGSMLTAMKNSGTVTEALTSEQISKTNDSNAAEALQRVTGVSVVGGRYVYVRGLGERYSQTQLNGASVGTPEPNKKVVPLDIFPTEVLDNMTVQKTYTPDMDGEFGGSVISLNTKDYAKDMFRQSLTLGQTEFGSAQGTLSYHGGGLDFLGIDDGTRALPGIINEKAGDTRVNKENFTREQLAEFGKAFSDVWTPQETNSFPDLSYTGLLSRQAHPFGKETGLLASFSLSNHTLSLQKQDNVYLGSVIPSALHLYEVSETEKSALWGLNLAASTKFSETGKLKANVLYTRNSDDVTRISSGMNNDRGSVVRTYSLAYVERGLFSGVLQGEQGLGFLDSKLDWNAAYSRANRNEPDHRRTTYELVDTTFALTGAGDRHPLTRIYGEAVDDDRTFKLNWTLPFRFDARDASFRTGLAYNNKDRSSAYRRFGFTDRLAPSGSDIDRTLAAEELVSADNILRGIYTVEELTRANDSYSAHQEVRAGFLMVDMQPLPKLRMTGGTRFEDSKQSVDARSPFAIVDPGTRVEKHFQDFLPAINLTYTPNSRNNIRAAYSRTLNRPELREVSPFTMDNYESGYEETGDTSLVEARLENVDLRWELYPGPRELLAVGLFHKRLDQPIVRYVFPNVSGYAERPVNGVDLDGKPGTLYGWEGEVRLSLVDLWRGLDWTVDLGSSPGFLGDWSVAANYSRVQSETHVVSASHKVVTVPLAGQSEYSANIGLFYGHHKCEGALLYRSFGPRLTAFGFGNLKDIYEYPPKSLDLNLSYRLSGKSRLKFSAENLLDQELEFKQGDMVTQGYKLGTTFGISVSYEAPGGEE